VSVEVGQQLLQYRLVEVIGQGGMGVVWKAVDTALDRPVAIKLLHDELAADSERLGGSRRILDVGSGLGQFTRAMARAAVSDVEVLGIERDRRQIAEAERQAVDNLTGVLARRRRRARSLGPAIACGSASRAGRSRNLAPAPGRRPLVFVAAGRGGPTGMMSGSTTSR